MNLRTKFRPSRVIPDFRREIFFLSTRSCALGKFIPRQMSRAKRRIIRSLTMLVQADETTEDHDCLPDAFRGPRLPFRWRLFFRSGSLNEEVGASWTRINPLIKALFCSAPTTEIIVDARSNSDTRRLLVGLGRAIWVKLSNLPCNSPCWVMNNF